MDAQKFANVLDFYIIHSALAEKERTGWINWNVSGRRESVLDHVSSAQALAWALYSEFDELEDINIEHVISLLSLHEEGESIIGDISPYEDISPDEKAKKEWKAYTSICEPLRKGKYILSLFAEFEAKETPEAQFAYLCDKLDCDLRAKIYSEACRCSIENATYKIASNENVQKIISEGAKTVWDVFWNADKSKYTGTFLEDFFNFIK